MSHSRRDGVKRLHRALSREVRELLSRYVRSGCVSSHVKRSTCACRNVDRCRSASWRKLNCKIGGLAKANVNVIFEFSETFRRLDRDFVLAGFELRERVSAFVVRRSRLRGSALSRGCNRHARNRCAIDVSNRPFERSRCERLGGNTDGKQCQASRQDEHKEFSHHLCPFLSYARSYRAKIFFIQSNRQPFLSNSWGLAGLFNNSCFGG